MATWPAPKLVPNVTIYPQSLEALGASNTSLGGSALSKAAPGTWNGANVAIYVPFNVYTITTFVMMFLWHGASVTGNVDLGIYDVNGTRLTSMGSTAQVGTSTVKAYDIPDVTLSPGLYYMACVASATGSKVYQGSTLTANNVRTLGIYEQTSALPLPATATFAAASNMTSIPIFGVSTSTLL